MNPKLIVINGKTYNSVDEMPEDVRKEYEEAMSTLKDENRNYIPDAFENMNILQTRIGMASLICWKTYHQTLLSRVARKSLWMEKSLTASQICRLMSRPDMNKQRANWMQTKMGGRTLWKE